MKVVIVSGSGYGRVSGTGRVRWGGGGGGGVSSGSGNASRSGSCNTSSENGSECRGVKVEIVGMVVVMTSRGSVDGKRMCVEGDHGFMRDGRERGEW